MHSRFFATAVAALPQPFDAGDVSRRVKDISGTQPSRQWSRVMLARAAKAGALVRVAHGLYATPAGAAALPAGSFAPRGAALPLQPQKNRWRKVKLTPGKYRIFD